jgi:RNA polymerase sigma-70 factor, ECF subfamily
LPVTSGASTIVLSDLTWEPFVGSNVKAPVPPSLQLVRSPAPDTAPAGRRVNEIDADTLSRAQRGEAAACRALVVAYEARVFAVVARTLGARNAARVEDVAQETFLRVFKSLASFTRDGPAQLSTWILTIAMRLCFDELRRAKRTAQRMRDEELRDDDARAPDVSEPLAIERALKRRIERAIDELPEDLKATFVLRVIGEVSVADAAKALDVDEGTIKSRLSRARDRLRAALGDA